MYRHSAWQILLPWNAHDFFLNELQSTLWRITMQTFRSELKCRLEEKKIIFTRQNFFTEGVNDFSQAQTGEQMVTAYRPSS